MVGAQLVAEYAAEARRLRQLSGDYLRRVATRNPVAWDLVAEPVCEIGTDERFHVWNPAMVDLVQREPHQVLGLKVSDLWPLFWDRREGHAVRAAFEGARTLAIVEMEHHGRGVRLPYREVYEPVTNDAGTVVACRLSLFPVEE